MEDSELAHNGGPFGQTKNVSSALLDNTEFVSSLMSESYVSGSLSFLVVLNPISEQKAS